MGPRRGPSCGIRSIRGRPRPYEANPACSQGACGIRFIGGGRFSHSEVDAVVVAVAVAVVVVAVVVGGGEGGGDDASYASRRGFQTSPKSLHNSEFEKAHVSFALCSFSPEARTTLHCEKVM